jgi:hypothetical protein
MTREAARIDIATMPDLARLAEEVARTRTSRVIARGDEDLAVLSPAKAKRRPAGKRVTQADIAAALGAIGSWKDLVDSDRLTRELDEARSDDSPPVEL